MENTCQVCILNTEDCNFCVRSAPLRVHGDVTELMAADSES